MITLLDIVTDLKSLANDEGRVTCVPLDVSTRHNNTRIKL